MVNLLTDILDLILLNNSLFWILLCWIVDGVFLFYTDNLDEPLTDALVA